MPPQPAGPHGFLLSLLHRLQQLGREILHIELGWNLNCFWFRLWRIIVQYFAPLAILLILLSSAGIL